MTCSKFVTAVAVTALAVALNVRPAGAPMLGVQGALEAQRRLGYSPCQPALSPLPQERVDEGILGDADNGVQSGDCRIRLAADIPADLLPTVVFHEVCHLSTVQRIADSPDRYAYGEDWAHKHPLFKECLSHGPADTGGY
jgi:hypothetical protein